MESFFVFWFRNKWHRTHFTKFLYISSPGGGGSVVNSEFAKQEPKHNRFKDFETRGRKFSNFSPFKSTCGGLSV